VRPLTEVSRAEQGGERPLSHGRNRGDESAFHVERENEGEREQKPKGKILILL